MSIDITKLKRRLLVKYPAFGSITANLNYVESMSLETAGTDGTTLYYNSDFLKNLSDDEQTFLFAHEICHVAFRHIEKSEGKDSNLWNIATDAVINAMLQQDGLKMIQGCVDISEAINYNAEEMYEKLRKEQEQNPQSKEKDSKTTQSKEGESSGQNANTQPGQSSTDEENRDNQQQDSTGSSNSSNTDDDKKVEEESSSDVGHDTHKMWEEALQKAKDSKQGNDSAHDDKSEEMESKEQREKREKIEEASQKLSELGEKETFEQNIVDRKKQLDELRKSLAKKSVQAGDYTNSDDRILHDIGVSAPLIDWRRILKEAVKYDVDWSYQNAALEDGVVTPYLEEIPHPETEILLDTSGSIDESLLRNFLRECKNILHTSKIKVGCFDTKFYGFVDIRNEEDIDRMQFYGGGGTDFDVAVNAFTRRVENKIIFTDGEASMPDKAIDAIWIVFGRMYGTPKGGKVIHITSEQLDRLCRYNISDSSLGRSR